MGDVAKLSAFILLIIGTLGLLINEFILDWGRTATLPFAVVNIVGLAILAFTHWGMKTRNINVNMRNGLLRLIHHLT